VGQADVDKDRLMLAAAISQIKEQENGSGSSDKRKKTASVVAQLSSAQMGLLKRLNPLHFLMVQRARDIQIDHPELGAMEAGFDWEFDADDGADANAASQSKSKSDATGGAGGQEIKMHCDEFLTERRKAEQKRVRLAKRAHDLHQQESVLRQQSVDDELSELFGDGDGGGYASSNLSKGQTHFDNSESMEKGGTKQSDGSKGKKKEKGDAAYLEVLELLDAIEEHIDAKKADLKLRGRICVEVRQCRALPQVQSIGKQDPIVIALLGHQLQKTDYVWGGSTDPVWRDADKSKLLFDLYEKDEEEKDEEEKDEDKDKEDGEEDEPVGDKLRFEVRAHIMQCISCNYTCNPIPFTRLPIHQFHSSTRSPTHPFTHSPSEPPPPPPPPSGVEPE
jgi:hypothetical protein